MIPILLVLVRPASASGPTVDPSIATAGAITPSAVIQEDLGYRTWTLHPTAGYFTGSIPAIGANATVTAHGFGGTGEAQYSLNEHIGVNFSALGYSGGGSYTPATSSDGSAGTTSVSGWLVGATLVLDPFSGKGFRMPFFFGLNYQRLTSSTPTSPLFTSMTLYSPGYSFGFSPRFNVWFLRFEPFLVATTSTSEGTVTCSSDVVAGACGAQNIQTLPVFGVNIVFRPLNLSLYFNLSSTLFGTGVSYYSIGPHLTF
jgi:hypothetical protein